MGHFKIVATTAPQWAQNAWVLRAACRDDARNSSPSMSSFVWRSAQGTYATDGHRLHLDEDAVFDGLEGISIQWLRYGDTDGAPPPTIERVNGAATLSSLLSSIKAPTMRGTSTTAAVTAAIKSLREEGKRRDADAGSRTKWTYLLKIGPSYFQASYIADAVHGVEEWAWKIDPEEGYGPIVIESPNRTAIVMSMRYTGQADCLAYEIAVPVETAKRQRKGKRGDWRKVAAAISNDADAAMTPVPAPLPPAPEPISYRIHVRGTRHSGSDLHTGADIHAVMDAVRTAWLDGECVWATSPDGAYLAGIGRDGLWNTEERLQRHLADMPEPGKVAPYHVHVGAQSSEWRTFGAAQGYALAAARRIGDGAVTVVGGDRRIAARYVAAAFRVVGDSNAIGTLFAV